jgi:hypothetical protein
MDTETKFIVNGRKKYLPTILTAVRKWNMLG